MSQLWKRGTEKQIEYMINMQKKRENNLNELYIIQIHMKRKRRTKKSHNQNDSPLSTKSNSLNWKINKLVTSQEQTLASQASVYTQKTNKTRTTDLHKEEEFLEDEVNRDEIADIFVSEEEERVIKTVLEIARKGKITQKNSFEIPLKVVENDEQFMLKTRFWKFASELLGASVSIYDKRVQNTWLTANKIDSKLKRIRINKKDFKDEDEDDEGTSSRRSNNNQFVILEDFLYPQSVNYQTIGLNTLEDQKKRNVANFSKQFTVDPLFFKKLKTFDQVNLSSMLLNTFEVSDNLEIKLFDEEKDKKKIVEKSDVKLMPEIEAIVHKSPQMLVIKSITELKTAFFEPANKEKENFRKEEILQDMNEFQVQFQNQKPFKFEEQMEALETQSINIPQSQFLDSSIHDLNSMSIKSQPLHSQNLFHYELISENLNEGNYSSMMPWEIILKSKKFGRKRMTSKKGKRGTKNKLQVIDENEINFDKQVEEDKRIILKRKNNKFGNKHSEKNLLPVSFHVHEIYYQNKRNTSKNLQSTQQTEPFFQQKGDEIYADTIKEENQNQHGDLSFDGEIHENVSFFGNFKTETEEENIKYRKFYEKNIRRVKEIVFEELNEERELKLSQLNTMLSPQSMLITFLHLANERQLVIETNENYSDVCLALE